MKWIKLLIFILLCTSCSWIKEESLDFSKSSYYSDTWVSGENRVTVATCTIQEWITGEEYILVEVENKVFARDTGMLLFGNFYDYHLLPYEFKRALRELEEQERTDTPIQFIKNAKEVEITWKMFDEIRKTYEN